MVLVLLVAVAPVAGAHAAYKSSEPASDATVDSAPSRVTAEFTEPLAEGSYLRVTGPCGERVDAGDVEIVGYEMSVSMSGAEAGRYVVSFRAFSRLDPHVTQGEFAFMASDGQACPGAQPQAVAERPERSSSDGAPSSAQDSLVSAAGDDGSDGASAAGGRVERADRPDRVASNRTEKPFRQAPERAVVPNLQAAAAREDEERSVWDGIPIASFVTGLLLAAVIGAAGGKIYAGIMGPRA